MFQKLLFKVNKSKHKKFLKDLFYLLRVYITIVFLALLNTIRFFLIQGFDTPYTFWHSKRWAKMVSSLKLLEIYFNHSKVFKKLQLCEYHKLPDPTIVKYHLVKRKFVKKVGLGRDWFTNLAARHEHRSLQGLLCTCAYGGGGG